MNKHPIVKSLKRLASLAPVGLQQELRRAKCFVDIKLGLHRSAEPEFEMLASWLKPGDWALDIGANVGTYTLEMARIVGPTGRVIAFEPLLETAEVLAAAVRWAGLTNVTIINAAASWEFFEPSLSVAPSAVTGLPDYFTATIGPEGTKKVLAFELSRLFSDNSAGKKLKLVKIDAEGHEKEVLTGLATVLHDYRPVVIAEAADELRDWMGAAFGYEMGVKTAGSPNNVFYGLRSQRAA